MAMQFPSTHWNPDVRRKGRSECIYFLLSVHFSTNLTSAQRRHPSRTGLFGSREVGALRFLYRHQLLSSWTLQKNNLQAVTGMTALILRHPWHAGRTTIIVSQKPLSHILHLCRDLLREDQILPLDIRSLRDMTPLQSFGTGSSGIPGVPAR